MSLNYNFCNWVVEVMVDGDVFYMVWRREIYED